MHGSSRQGPPPPEGMAYPEDLECPPGMMNSRCRRWERGAQYFAQWSENSDPPTNVATPSFTSIRQFVTTGDLSPRWWHIDVWGRSVLRAAGLVTFTPLPQNTIQEGEQISRARVRVGWNGASGGTIRTMTIGTGLRLDVYACGVSVAILAPPRATWGPQSSVIGGAVPELTGTVVDESVGVNVTDSCCGPRGFRSGTLVEVFRLANADPTQVVSIPPGARTLTISQAGGGALATVNFRFLTTAIQPVVMGAASRSALVEVPHHASDLFISGLGGDILTLEWGIDV